MREGRPSLNGVFHGTIFNTLAFIVEACYNFVTGTGNRGGDPEESPDSGGRACRVTPGHPLSAWMRGDGKRHRNQTASGVPAREHRRVGVKRRGKSPPRPPATAAARQAPCGAISSSGSGPLQPAGRKLELRSDPEPREMVPYYRIRLMVPVLGAAPGGRTMEGF